MSGQGKFDVQRKKGQVTLAGEGELSLYVAPEFRFLLEDAVESGDDVTVDLTRALYIDSAILMSLATTGKALSGAGRKLKVVVADNSHPQYVLRVSGMNMLFDIIVDKP